MLTDEMGPTGGGSHGEASPEPTHSAVSEADADLLDPARSDHVLRLFRRLLTRQPVALAVEYAVLSLGGAFLLA